MPFEPDAPATGFVPDTPPAKSGPPSETGGAIGLLSGIGGGALSTAFHLADMYSRGASGALRAVGIDPDKLPVPVRQIAGLESPLENPTVQELIKSRAGGMEHAGRTIETIGELAAPFIPAAAKAGVGAADIATAVTAGPAAAGKKFLLKSLMKALGRTVPEAEEAAPKAAEALSETAAKETPRIVEAGERASVPRSAERQAIVDELNTPKPVQGASNTVTSPATAEAGPVVSAREAGNRTKLAQEMAEKLHDAGATHADVRKLSPGDAFWKTLRSTVRSDAKMPSPATVQLALEHLKTLEQTAGAAAKVVPITSAPSAALKGKAADIARQLAEEMAQ